MSELDPVRSYLRSRGAALHVVEGGLEGLIERWRRAARGLEAGHGDFDDYLNDVDGRQILHEVLARLDAPLRARVRARVRRIDQRVRARLEPVGECLWGARAAREHGWSPAEQWWYFHRPRPPSAE